VKYTCTTHLHAKIAGFNVVDELVSFESNCVLSMWQTGTQREYGAWVVKVVFGIMAFDQNADRVIDLAYGGFPDIS
jgi:hypothetical protein